MSSPSDVRTSPIAGAWYPGAPRDLERAVDEMLARVPHAPMPGELRALIAPHAGLAYSGQTAAYAYRQIAPRDFDTVILLGPSHYEDFGAFAISAKKFYATPLGNVELDAEIIAALARRVKLNRVEIDREHSLEIQLPFLQCALKNFTIVPIMLSRPFYLIGADAYKFCQDLSFALAELLKPRRALIIASSDLSHLNDYAAVKEYDARFAELVAAFDIAALVEYMQQDAECRACGDSAVITALLAAKQLGANQTRVLHLTNSGDVTGMRDPSQYTVGYMAAGVYRKQNS